MSELREHLERAQNPVFYYDNDADGLCSFVLLRKFLGRGNGVAVRSYPDLNASYAHKASELKADYVFVLDKPVLSQEFVNAIQGMNLPFVWIDHHIMGDKNPYAGVQVYNSAGNGKSGEPVTAMVYNLTKCKEDLWIALMGCIADHHLPVFASEFKKEHPEYWSKGIKKPFDAYYKSEIGKLARAINFGLKDSAGNVIALQNFLISCRSPADMFAEVSENKSFREKYNELLKKYNSFIESAEKNLSEKMLFFVYGGEVSMSADIANELSYRHPEIFVVVAYMKGAILNLSLRGAGVKKMLEKILPKLENATGGGHADAVGARIRTSDLEKFKELLSKEIT